MNKSTFKKRIESGGGKAIETSGSIERHGVLIASRLAAFPMHITQDGFRAFADDIATVQSEGFSIDFEDFFRPRPAMTIDQNGIATINVCGVLAPSMPRIFEKLGNTDYNMLCAELAEAASTESIRGVLLLINSPGGSTVGHDEAHRAVLVLREQKPVMAFVGEQACSAAYGIASASSLIYAAGSSITGNIGSILTRLDFSQMYADAGVKCEVFASDPIKATFASSALASTEDQTAFVQEFVQQSADRFKLGVSAQRPQIKADDMRGQWYWGEQAAARGFIDFVGSREKAYADLCSICGPFEVDSGAPVDADQYPERRCIFVDVDGTLSVRGQANERVIKWCNDRKNAGFQLMLWSLQGEEYARDVAAKFGVSDLFDVIIGKPGYILDDKGWEWTESIQAIIPDESVERWQEPL